MALFKSKDERKMEREVRIRQGIRQIEKAIRQQAKFSDEFIANAQRARRVGDSGQYQFIRNALKKTATVKKMLERQLLAIKNALLIKQQAEANELFARSMGEMSREISRIFGATDLVKTQAQWEKAIAQAQTMEERMSIFLDSIEDLAAADAESSQQVVSDEEIDRMIEADVLASEKKELDELRSLTDEIESELGRGESTGKEK
ncbi:MAG: hypothetical protein BIFFINMI_03194 [Phycisphaerae bacterium]|nr:hypothetical protein [Phycisphaerae bacterium]